MDASTARLITSPEGLSRLASLPPYDATSALGLGQSLRDRGVSPELVAAVMTQSRLRAAAVPKFGDFAAGMLFTPEGLEQATRLPVAARHAQRFRDAGLSTIADLTCGIGADAMAASALGLAVMAFEIDEPTALIADHNLRHWPDTVVVHADALAVVRTTDVGGAFADPARRTARGRRHDPKDYTPSLDAVLELRDSIPALGVKVGPSIPHEAIPADVHAEWVSVDGSVVEAALWCGPLASAPAGSTPRHSALVIDGNRATTLTGSTDRAPVGELEEYIYEPDGAVIRAGLVGEVAHSINGHLIDATIAYVTAPHVVATPFATGYRVLETLPYSVKRLTAALRERGVGRVDIKKRGIAITPEQLRPQLKLRGDAHATVIVTRQAGRHVALIVEPLPRGD
ncbi:MAG: SAM-dependent methyltransferase [Actinobacteria bacterium HGW-Actinobacteria-4]|nr:MAG: SAM-dependent methyltransferase [Actinobacteria bacterium HGW-Actinobacteria-4]